MTRVSVIGATTWGNTLASLIAANGTAVRVWAKNHEQVRKLQAAHNENVVDSGARQEFSLDLDFVAEGCEVAIFAVPAQRVRRAAGVFAGRLKSTRVLASAAKGLESDTGKRMTEILAEEFGRNENDGLAVISGPNLSREINSGLPAVTVVASCDTASAKLLGSLLNSTTFSVVVSNDIRGVEICGALKNVIALGAGMSDGLELGSNAKAALVTVGWQEVIRLGMELGAEENTFYGYAGLGDLITTCISPLSRNYHTGFQLAKGKTLSEVLAGMSNVVEGVDTTRATHLLTARLGLELPLMEAIYRVLTGEMAASGISQYFLKVSQP